MFCPKCGSQITATASFCGNCGNAIVHNDIWQNAAAQQPPAAQAPAVQAQQPPAAQAPAAQAQRPASAGYAYGQPATGIPAPASAATAAAKGGSKALAAVIAGIIVVAAAAAIVFLVFKPSGTANALSAYQELMDTINVNGSWHEETELVIDMDMSGASNSLSGNMDMTMNMDVSNYDANNPSGTRITGDGTMDMSSLSSLIPAIDYTFVYENGQMTMDMGSYGTQTMSYSLEDMQCDPHQYDELLKNATINGNTITMVLSPEDIVKYGALNGANTSQLESLGDIDFGEMTMIIRLDEANRRIETTAEMDANINVSGYAMTMHMTINDTTSPR